MQSILWCFMRLWALSFLFGMLSLNFFKALGIAINVAISVAVISILLLIGTWFFKPYRKIILYLLTFLFGFSWMVFNAYSHFQTGKLLYSGNEGKKITVSGYISSLPERQLNHTRFEFRLLSNQRIRLSWSDAPKNLVIGEFLRLEIKLKKPYSLMNKNSFDHERWLFQQGIHAVAYVLPKNQEQRLEKAHWLYSKYRLRQILQEGIEKNLEGRSLSGMISGLTVGVRTHITPEQWQVMQATGTNHLMAISGLHIGFIASLIFFMVSWLWRRSSRLPLFIPAPQIAAIGALISGLMYSALAGFSLPTQRAVIMVAAFLLTTCFRKQLPAWQSWCLALLIILIFDPLAILSDSFWLSFGAVAVILYGMGGRLSTPGAWWKWGRTQWVVGLGLVPLTLLFFNQVSIIGLLANTIAIPWVGFIVLPISLLGSAFLVPWPQFGGFFLRFAETTLNMLWAILEWLATLPYMQFHTSIHNKWLLFAAMIGVFLLLAPRGIPGRYLGGFWILPLLLASPPQPKTGELWMTLLDVGQGLSLVIRTPNHVLVYDTGMRYGPDFDMGKAVIIPFLKSEGLKTIDRLVISHGDMDHIGGAKSLLKEFTVKAISSSVPEEFSTYQSQLCQAGQRWVWDGVIFEFLYPPKNYTKKRINDDSCVLRITHGRHRILLPGDIERAGEQYVLQNLSLDELKADILVVPHHGSRTSSTPAFVKAVNPEYALFAVGYRNRYRHPNLGVVERYKNSNSKIYFTSDSGAISFIIKDNEAINFPMQYRLDQGYYWSNIGAR
jgi:competence protein ComEC